uniref:Uncharacterized protein n=1 Tax=Lepeophtheirus salmonis TaxID=72036 RepID=A0A0K2VLY1_LEPSM
MFQIFGRTRRSLPWSCGLHGHVAPPSPDLNLMDFYIYLAHSGKGGKCDFLPQVVDLKAAIDSA